MVDQERDGLRGDPEREAKEWRCKLSEIATKRARFQELAAEDLLTLDELRAKLTELDEVREATELELSLLQNRVERVEALQRSKDAVLASLEETVPKALGELNAEERHQLYEMLKVRLTAGVDGSLELNGKLIPKHPVCTPGTTPAGSPTRTTTAGPLTYGGSTANPSGGTAPTRTSLTSAGRSPASPRNRDRTRL